MTYPRREKKRYKLVAVALFMRRRLMSFSALFFVHWASYQMSTSYYISARNMIRHLAPSFFGYPIQKIWMERKKARSFEAGQWVDYL